MAFLRHRFHAAVIFGVHDGVARGDVGFGGERVGDEVGGLAFPLGLASVLRTAHVGEAAFVGAPEPGPIHDRLVALFGTVPSRVVVVPIATDGTIVSLVYAHGPRLATPEEAAGELGSVVAAVEDAYVRVNRAPVPA
jgi:hypothetical protein